MHVVPVQKELFFEVVKNFSQDPVDFLTIRRQKERFQQVSAKEFFRAASKTVRKGEKKTKKATPTGGWLWVKRTGKD